MAPRLVIDGNDVYEIDEECECFKASIEEQLRMGKRVIEIPRSPEQNVKNGEEQQSPEKSQEQSQEQQSPEHQDS